MGSWDEFQSITEFILSVPTLSNGFGYIFEFIVIYVLKYKPYEDKSGISILKTLKLTLIFEVCHKVSFLSSNWKF